MLEVNTVSYQSGKTNLLDNVSVHFKPGQFSMIIGPNGAGKSTLMRIMSGDILPQLGSVHYGSVLLDKKRLLEISRVRATLSQNFNLPFPLTVEEVVMMGRYPHFSFKSSEKDIEICKLALQKLSIESLSHRNYLTLSGGEKQRVHFAKTLAQIWEEPKNGGRYLLLDEPIASLDPNYQHEFLKIAYEMSREGLVVIAVMHDINLASRYGDYFIALKQGNCMIAGDREEVLKSNILAELYDLNCIKITSESTDYPIFIFDKDRM